MRISDWSSDVCSSDLGRTVAGNAGISVACLARLDRRARYLDGLCPISRLALVPASTDPLVAGGCCCLLCKNSLEFISRGCCRSEEHTSELQSLMRLSYAVFCLLHKKKL